MRVAVVDIGTNSTRLLVADVADGRVAEVERRTTITRLGEGVDRNRRLLPEAIDRVLSTCVEYREAIDRHRPDRTVAVLTAATRDAANGPELERLLRERFGFEAQTISGEREARLTYLGAKSARRYRAPVLVLDIGGGSTEFVVGSGDVVAFHVSTHAGSVRHTERTLHSDPPTDVELARCAGEIQAEIERAVPAEVRRTVADGVAVAGTPTSFAAIDQALEPYDRDRVDGYRLTRAGCERILERLAALPLRARAEVAGLHPQRAPTILAGGVILIEAMRAFGLESIEVSEHDILHGVALEAASGQKVPARNGSEGDKNPHFG
jgi:exopolyphosphatase / guanosine-5'-triphosphate,3'-diphosphate pyrophosphatase